MNVAVDCPPDELHCILQSIALVRSVLSFLARNLSTKDTRTNSLYSLHNPNSAMDCKLCLVAKFVRVSFVDSIDSELKKKIRFSQILARLADGLPGIIAKFVRVSFVGIECAIHCTLQLSLVAIRVPGLATCPGVLC